MTPTPFSHIAGCHDFARIVFLAEAWGEREAELGLPLVGSSGIEFTRMMLEASGDTSPLAREITANFYNDAKPTLWIDLRQRWLEQHRITLTNVLALRPPNNKLEAICVSKPALPPGYPPLRPITKLGAKPMYLDATLLDEPRRALLEIASLRPNLVVALGNTACWLMLQATNIGSIRGAVAISDPSGVLVSATVSKELPLGMKRVKVLPTYHPAGVLRNWSWRPIVVADMMKAFREAEFSDLRRPERRILVNPSLMEVQTWTRDTLTMQTSLPWLSVDCETKQGAITCIGFARSTSEAMVVPFAGPLNGSYWGSPLEEMVAWDCVQMMLESDIPKVFQNGLYDLQYILPMGIRPKHLLHDTMLLHHSMFPEMQKGLGFLGSIYTQEASWKLMRRRQPDSEKRDE